MTHKSTPAEPTLDEVEIEPGVVVVSPSTFDRVATTGGQVRVPFVDYASVVQRTPDRRSADRYGLVPSLVSGPVKLVTGVGKLRREQPMVLHTVTKVLSPGPAPRINRLRLVLDLHPE